MNNIIEIIENCITRGVSRRYTLKQCINGIKRPLKQTGNNLTNDEIMVLAEPIYAQIQREANS